MAHSGIVNAEVEARTSRWSRVGWKGDAEHKVPSAEREGWGGIVSLTRRSLVEQWSAVIDGEIRMHGRCKGYRKGIETRWMKSRVEKQVRLKNMVIHRPGKRQVLNKI